MKLTLRDLFWFVLFIASLTLWGIEHRQAANQIDAMSMNSFFVRLDRGAVPSEAELKRQDVVSKVARFTDDQLGEFVDSDPASPQHRDHVGYEACLLEMANRRLCHRLQQHYDAFMTSERETDWFPNNLEFLTALRRAQQQPDPLRIHVQLLDHHLYGSNEPGPWLQAKITNVDVGQEPVFLVQGGDDRGGRRERWQVLLTDAHGRSVADANYSPGMGGGLCSFGPLEYGQTGEWVNVLDLRRYVAPPPSGSYQLQVLYHNHVGIAGERELTGLIVSKSEPISVVISNPNSFPTALRNKAVLPLCITLLACGKLALIATFARGLANVSPRDLFWFLVLAVLAVGFSLDGLSQISAIARLCPDAHSHWSITLANTLSL